MIKYAWQGYVSRDISPIIEQRKRLCGIYLKKICGLDGNNAERMRTFNIW